MHTRRLQLRWRAVAALTLAVAVVAGCSSGSDDASSGSAEATETIDLVGFAVPEAANKAIAEEWASTPEGDGVEFVTSYGASGDQSRAVADGLPADYVHFSVPSDVTRLVDAGLVSEDWDQGANEGVVSTSLVVFAVPKGNPNDIQDWDDLIQPGVEIVTPNPASSGAARWNALAAWGQVIANGGTEEEALDYVTKLYATWCRCPAADVTPPPPSPAARATSSSPTRTRRSWPARTARTSTTSSRPRR